MIGAGGRLFTGCLLVARQASQTTNGQPAKGWPPQLRFALAREALWEPPLRGSQSALIDYGGKKIIRKQQAENDSTSSGEPFRWWCELMAAFGALM